jgi:hypothetical protein
MERKKTSTPGLRYRTRADGTRVPIWCARPDAIKAGFPIKTSNLSETPPELLAVRCQRLWAEMLDFLGRPDRPFRFDGTIRSVLDLYTGHKDSPFHKLKPSSRHPYESYIYKLRRAHGATRLRDVTGLDVMRWHEVWREPIEEGGAPRLAAAAMCIRVLQGSLNWALVCGYKECQDLRGVISLLRLPGPMPREHAPDAQAIELARAAAHKLGRPRAALAYAIQFEVSARQWDVIGQWVPLSDPRPSSIIWQSEKWLGLTWAAIDENMILSFTPTKTEKTTHKQVQIDLSLCPMVMEELALIPVDERVGPMIINEQTGRPYRREQFQWLWRQVRDRANLSPKLWNRDIRAGAITEGGMAGASADDRAKLAAHSPKMTKSVYDRDVLVSANRVAEARRAFREKSEK